ncbi:MAG: cyclase family protein [Flavobacteriales bacterium]|nr:cyclase family protein [Flavobacteriales bacterium]MCL4856699.1 cyclase family protein [Flavobacteriales bacterium]
MKATIEYKNNTYQIDLSKPLDIAMPLKADDTNPTAWYVSPPEFTPVMEHGFVGDVNLGGAVNFRNIFFNPHGHGTHTECVGHISKEFYTINQCLKQFFCLAKLVTILPEKQGDNQVITLQQIQSVWNNSLADAVVIRTLPNLPSKLEMQYSNTNPAFIHHEAVGFLVENGVKHILIDTPSVDKEEDGGALISHHIFWNYPENPNLERTITELIFVDDYITDGEYFLNLQIAPFENDASPSKPILYKII